MAGLLAVGLFLLQPLSAAVGSPETGLPWVVQMGYFANLDNALNFKQLLSDAGFEARVVSTGKPGEERYRVITGQSETAAEMEDHLREVQERTGHEGFVTRDPLLTDESREVFDAPKSQYLVAQANADLPLDPSPKATIGYESALARTPQEQIESIPGFTAGGFQIVPTVGLSVGYDDNITRSSFEEISSWFYMISPAVRVELPSDRSVLGLMLTGDWIRYQDSPIDDRETWTLRGYYAWDISNRQDLFLFAEYSEGADARGTGRRQGDAGLLPVEPDEWERTGFGGSWDYGAVGARGRIELRAGAYDLEYTNNRDDDFESGLNGTRTLDRDWWYGGGTFYWRIAPKSSLLADYQYTDMNYKEESTQDSEMHTWMLGLTWDATARTSGRISYGKQKRKFDDPFMEDYDGAVWLASATWRPRTYSSFTLTGSRSTQEPNGFGDYILRQDITLSWLHDWATRFGTNVDIGYGEDDYHPDGRQDDIWYWGIGLRYTLNPHIRFGASVTGYDRNSDDPEFDYQRMVYMLTLEASF